MMVQYSTSNSFIQPKNRICTCREFFNLSYTCGTLLQGAELHAIWMGAFPIAKLPSDTNQAGKTFFAKNKNNVCYFDLYVVYLRRQIIVHCFSAFLLFSDKAFLRQH